MKQTIKRLRDFQPDTKPKVFLGFDAFVDTIVRVVKKGDALHPKAFFTEMGEFGLYLAERGGKNASVELSEVCTKIGGNVPNCAGALWALGADAACVGGFGLPDIQPAFAQLSQRCRLYSVGNPGLCTALEFDDGKVMLGLNKDVNTLDFEVLEKVLGIERLQGMVEDSRAVCILNWSEMPGATNLFAGMTERIFPGTRGQKYLFVDLSDCGRRGMDELQTFLGLLQKVPKNFASVLSLNQNEDRAVCQALGIPAGLPDAQRALQICGKLGLYGILLHRRERCYVSVAGEGGSFETLSNGPAQINTGAGDHFNACALIGLMMGLSAQQIASFASCGAGFYVEKGYSGTIQDITGYMEAAHA